MLPLTGVWLVGDNHRDQNQPLVQHTVVLEVVEEAAAVPGTRIGGLALSRSRNSLVGTRKWARASFRSCCPFRQVSITKATLEAITRGSQPPSNSLVVFAAKNMRSTSSSEPFSR